MMMLNGLHQIWIVLRCHGGLSVKAQYMCPSHSLTWILDLMDPLTVVTQTSLSFCLSLYMSHLLFPLCIISFCVNDLVCYCEPFNLASTKGFLVFSLLTPLDSLKTFMECCFDSWQLSKTRPGEKEMGQICSKELQLYLNCGYYGFMARWATRAMNHQLLF